MRRKGRKITRGGKDDEEREEKEVEGGVVR